MDKRNAAMHVLDYWYAVDFLNQSKFPKESLEQAIYKKTNPTKLGKVFKDYIVSDLSQTVPLLAFVQADKEKLGYRMHSKITVFLGKVNREKYIQKIAAVLPFDLADLAKLHPENELYKKLTEKYGDISALAQKREDVNEFISLATFQLESDGQLDRNSFSVSPTVWAAMKVHHGEEGHPLSEQLKEEEFQAFQESFRQKLLQTIDGLKKPEDVCGLDFAPFVQELMDAFEEKLDAESSIIILKVMLDKYEKSNIFNPYYKMQGNHYSKDLKMVLDALKDEQMDISEDFLNYICAPHLSEDPSFTSSRYDVMHPSDHEKYRQLMHDLFQPGSAPLGRWPSKFDSAYAPQMDINLFCKKRNGQLQALNGDIFSVNGPPGTGKTTMLKEIIVHSVVEKAILLAQYDKPEDAFEKCSFLYGPIADENGESTQYNTYVHHYGKLKDDRINDYSIVIASSNNKAVENITRELPQSMQGDLAKKKPDIADLFLHENNPYFSVPAALLERQMRNETDLQKLPADSLAWGLVSIALGNKKNLFSSYVNAIFPLLKSWNPEKEKEKGKFLKQKAKFLEQLETVVQLTATVEAQYETGQKPSEITEDFVEQLLGSGPESLNAHIKNPFADEKLNLEREKLFYEALQLTQAFVLESQTMKNNIQTLYQYFQLAKNKTEKKDKNGKNVYEPFEFDSRDIDEFLIPVFQSLSILVPAYSSTFSSIQDMFKDIRQPKVFGILIVDEAGQAQPQEIIGSLFRSRRSIIVGDPKQIEPIVTEEVSLLRKAYLDDILAPYILDKTHSVQRFADTINKVGTYLKSAENPEKEEWVGAPLVVHRRCISPMFDISNNLSYAGIMKPAAMIGKGNYYSDKSLWIDVSGTQKTPKDHFIEEQGQAVMTILNDVFEKNANPDIFLISPYKTVADGFKEFAVEYTRRHPETAFAKYFHDKTNDIYDWLIDKVGTVHTFQGKGAAEVIFLLGCDLDSAKSMSFVNSNIINVAATRAKQRLYVIGDKASWTAYNPLMAEAARLIDEQV